MVVGWGDPGLCPLPAFGINGDNTSVSDSRKLSIRWILEKYVVSMGDGRNWFGFFLR
jgi:hypothetical protein